MALPIGRVSGLHVMLRFRCDRFLMNFEFWAYWWFWDRPYFRSFTAITPLQNRICNMYSINPPFCISTFLPGGRDEMDLRYTSRYPKNIQVPESGVGSREKGPGSTPDSGQLARWLRLCQPLQKPSKNHWKNNGFLKFSIGRPTTILDLKIA